MQILNSIRWISYNSKAICSNQRHCALINIASPGSDVCCIECLSEYCKSITPEPSLHMACDTLSIVSLPPYSRAVIDADSRPIITAYLKRRQEYPARGTDIETRIKPEPGSYITRRTANKCRKLRHPPGVDLQRAKIM